MTGQGDESERLVKARNAIRDALTKTLRDMRPALAMKHGLTQQVTELAIAMATATVAAHTAINAAGLDRQKFLALERKLHSAIAQMLNNG